MKTRSPELAAAQAAEVTTLAWCLRIESVGGDVFARTSVDIPLTISGDTYDPVDGIAPTALQGSADLSVQNMEVSGFLTALGINEADILSGKWDGAHCSLFEVNYTDLSQGVMRLQSGTLGQISVSRMTYQSELRGLAQALQQTNGKVVTKNCTAQLGDDKCKVDLAPFTVSGTVTSVSTRRTFTDASRAEPVDWFRYGYLTWLTGPNAGASMEIASSSNAAIGLVLPMSENITAGDTYTMVAGCNKTLKGNQSRYGHVSTDVDAGTYTIYDSTRTEAAGTYAGGSITWQDGANNSGSVNVVASAVGSFELALALPEDAYVGDAYIISPPTTVLFNGDCKAKFNNVLNYRGFPNIPGADTVLGLGGTEGTNL